MNKINLRIAFVVAIVGLLLAIIATFTAVLQQPWFIFVVALWVFTFCSASYRLTSLFKMRNPICDFLKRDTQHIILFSLNGFFDSKSGPQWLVVESIKRIEIRDDYICFYNQDESDYSVSLPASKAELEHYLHRFFTREEWQSITLY